MPVTLPASYNNALARQADVTSTMTDLYNVVQQLNGATGTGIGYVTGQGVGGSVTQITNRSTAVTLDKLTGTIIGDNTSLAAGADATFVVNNSTVTSFDTVILTIRSGPTANTSIFVVSAIANGSFSIRIKNVAAATADTGIPIINFCVIKGSPN